MENINKRLIYIEKKFGIEEGELSQDWNLAVLEGRCKHQTLDQFAIDWLRKNRVNTRAKSADQKRALLFARSETADGEPIVVKDPENYFSKVNSILDFARFADQLSTHERVAVILTDFGFLQNEIGYVLGVSSSRVSQYLKSVYKKMEALREN